MSLVCSSLTTYCTKTVDVYNLKNLWLSLRFEQTRAIKNMTTVVTIHLMESRFNIPLELYKVMIPLGVTVFSLLAVLVFTQVEEKTYHRMYDLLKRRPM